MYSTIKQSNPVAGPAAMPGADLEAAIEASQGASQLSEGHAVAVAMDESLRYAAAGRNRGRCAHKVNCGSRPKANSPPEDT